MIQNSIVGVNHIALQLSSLEEGMQFFSELLGFKVKFRASFESYEIIMLKAGKIELEMWAGQPNGDWSADRVDIGVHHIAVQVKDLEAVVAHMKDNGIKILADIYEPTQGIREAIVEGPDGVRVQFVEQNIPLLIWRAVRGDFKER